MDEINAQMLSSRIPKIRDLTLLGRGGDQWTIEPRVCRVPDELSTGVAAAAVLVAAGAGGDVGAGGEVSDETILAGA